MFQLLIQLGPGLILGTTGFFNRHSINLVNQSNPSYTQPESLRPIRNLTLTSTIIIFMVSSVLMRTNVSEELTMSTIGSFLYWTSDFSLTLVNLFYNLSGFRVSFVISNRILSCRIVVPSEDFDYNLKAISHFNFYFELLFFLPPHFPATKKKEFCEIWSFFEIRNFLIVGASEKITLPKF